MDFDEILTRITGKGDVGAIAIGLVAGYLLDWKYPLPGMPHSTAAGLGALLATGVKNTIESVLNHFTAGRIPTRIAQQQRQELRLAAAEIEKLEFPRDPLLTSTLARLRSDRMLWERRLLTDQDFKNTITNFVDRYRRVMEHPIMVAPAAGNEPPLRAMDLNT
jgi:hypothetical protein